MTEFKMKRIGLRLVVISVISLAVFLSIRKQYNTAQSMLQQNVALSPASLKAEEDAADSAAYERSGKLGSGNVRRWVKNRLGESLVKFEIDLVNDKDSNYNGGGEGQEEEEEVVFYETVQDRENIFVPTVDSQQPEGEVIDSEDVDPTGDIAKAYTVLVRAESENRNDFTRQTETLPEDSHLEMLVEVENRHVENGDDVEDTGGDGEGVTPNVVEVYITPLPNNDAAETDGDAQNFEEEFEDIIDEFDEYTDESKRNKDMVLQVTKYFTPTEVTFSHLRGFIGSPEHRDPGHFTASAKVEGSFSIYSQHLRDQAKDFTNVLQMSFIAPSNTKLPMVAPTPSLSADARILQETLTQGLLSSILGNQLSPRMVRYLRYKLLASLRKSRNEDITDSPEDANTLQGQWTPTPKVDVMKNDVTQQSMFSYEIRPLEVNDLAANDVKNAKDKIVFLSEPDPSVYSDHNHPSSFTATTPHVYGYDNPRPLSDAEYTLLRTRTNIQPHITSQATSSSDAPGSLSTRNPLDDAIPLSQGDHQNSNNRIVFSPKFLTTPSWMKPVLQGDQTFTNDKPFREDETLHQQRELFQQTQLSDQVPNTIEKLVNKNDVGNYQTNMSDQHEQGEEAQRDPRDFRSFQVPTENHVPYRQLKSQGLEREAQRLQEHNDPGEPGHSYQDILMQQRVQIDQPILGISSKDILTPLEAKDLRRYPLSRAESCPREVKLGDRPHAITALVAFPGDDTKWMRQILEQLFGETTDSLYDITADLQAGDVSRVYEMSKHVAIQTHSALDRNFERALVLIRNPYSVEERHQIFRPDYIDWQKQYLWGDTYSSWLSSDLPLYVIVYEDMVESPLTELIKLADFLRNDDHRVSYQCALNVAEKPPKMVSDLREITGIYFKERRSINANIDKVLQIANSRFPDLTPRLESYKV